MYTKAGDKIVIAFKNDAMHGKGVNYAADGIKYEVEYVDGVQKYAEPFGDDVEDEAEKEETKPKEDF